MQDSISIFWFRRDLRLEDNTALNAALSGDDKVLPIFIFDTDIIEELEENDPRVSFIHTTLQSIDKELRHYGTAFNAFMATLRMYLKQLSKSTLLPTYILIRTMSLMH